MTTTETKVFILRNAARVAEFRITGASVKVHCRTEIDRYSDASRTGFVPLPFTLGPMTLEEGRDEWRRFEGNGFKLATPAEGQ
jgi:hypothetical protein